MAISPDSAVRNRGSRIINKTIVTEREKFRSAALRNKYGCTPFHGVPQYFVCFSEAEKFAAIFPAALTFSLVLSLVSRQEKEHIEHGTSTY